MLSPGPEGVSLFLNFIDLITPSEAVETRNTETFDFSFGSLIVVRGSCCRVGILDLRHLRATISDAWDNFLTLSFWLGRSPSKIQKCRDQLRWGLGVPTRSNLPRGKGVSSCVFWSPIYKSGLAKAGKPGEGILSSRAGGFVWKGRLGRNLETCRLLNQGNEIAFGE